MYVMCTTRCDLNVVLQVWLVLVFVEEVAVRVGEHSKDPAQAKLDKWKPPEIKKCLAGKVNKNRTSQTPTTHARIAVGELHAYSECRAYIETHALMVLMRL